MALTVITANLLRTMSDAAFSASLAPLLATEADLIGLQEVRTRRRLLERLDGWGVWMPDDPTAANNAILYRERTVKLTGGGTRLMTVGGADYPARWASWIEGEHRPSGKPIVHLNTHCTSHIDKGGHPRNLPRVKANTLHLSRLADLYQSLNPHGLVVVTGDWNVDYRRDRIVRDPRFPYAKLTRAGLRCTYERLGRPVTSTHGRRLIDAVYHEPRLRPTAQRILKRRHSDHRPVLVKFDV